MGMLFSIARGVVVDQPEGSGVDPVLPDPPGASGTSGMPSSSPKGKSKSKGVVGQARAFAKVFQEVYVPPWAGRVPFHAVVHFDQMQKYQLKWQSEQEQKKLDKQQRASEKEREKQQREREKEYERERERERKRQYEQQLQGAIREAATSAAAAETAAASVGAAATVKQLEQQKQRIEQGYQRISISISISAWIKDISITRV
ncbi:hypothetical protein BASA62_010513 [Batrachochytrium salamandrivorans]|nr:hypothetical protein BASA62_010513 [Batrachochytrium salamandrivorans]